MILLGLGVAITVIGALVLSDEWRRTNSQRAALLGLGFRLEYGVGAALAIGLGVAMAYAGVSA